ncbi:DUF421 domain-containing protein [Sphingobacterium paludis]|uniref:Uncharacterized membrane protein YcaP (DUF421 family) n=1 Tax=Sphingobacterium paludis TaxID=1476465 RepID=A0A4R7DBT1_9SPHI|nr:YetF domain-containing protein [Sphingobacterium paludis]TDS17635.1 uncharacterized membrane protein YcaP (DUF421 family) [Sphingobacterium paludis]
MLEIEKLFVGGANVDFLTEIIWRTVIMFILILIILRLSGRRGVRQLTLFEVAIIISLGSAAGDPMFQEDVPVVYSIVVFGCVMGVYKLVTWLASRFKWMAVMMEGKAMTIVKDGMFDVRHENEHDFSKMEFFAELRNLSIEHLGQVREGILEVDGTMSVLYYSDEETKPGLPLFPSHYIAVNPVEQAGPFACMYCGGVQHEVSAQAMKCHRCGRDQWTLALASKRA